MPTIKVLDERLGRYRAAQPKDEKKDPRYWPFCICCHLAAPERQKDPKAPRTSFYDGPEADLSNWSSLKTPNGRGGHEEHHMCPDCAAFQVTQLVRHHNAQKTKLEKITASMQKGEKCGLRLQGHLNPFQSAFCSKRKGHTDACGPG